MQDNEEIDQIQEWQDHQYNPIYWVNKFSPLFPPKKTRGVWVTSLIGLGLSLPAFLAFCWSYFADKNSGSLAFVLIFGALSIIMTFLAVRLRPDSDKGKSQINQYQFHNQQKKKKLPKRRKDYH